MQSLLNLREENLHEDGFTLIEILVVILIIGILAAIAIPVFLNQRKTANDAAAETDAKNVTAVIEEYITKNPNATTIDATYVRNNFKKTPGSAISVYGSPNHYCVTGAHSNGKRYLLGMTYAENNNRRPYFLYSSIDGGKIKDETTNLVDMPCYHSGFHMVNP